MSMQTIKKYANRKLYHTNRKQYITLEGIAALIQGGEQIQVVDNETGEDITAQILSQVVLQARGNGGRLPTHVLTGLIQAGGDTIAGMRRSLWMTLGGSAIVEAEIKHRLDQLLEAGTIGEEEAGRIKALLIETADAGAPAEPPDVPSHSDIQHLHAQVDALASAVEQLLAERQK
jgi:polyhydroxyalkanoate synthesis repressor PhaR